MGELRVVAAQWPAPPGIRALTTTRKGGVSTGPYTSMNPASHVGDSKTAVARNRELLMQELELPERPRWLRQVHGNRVLDAEGLHPPVTEGDGVVTGRAGIVCAVLTADCLPLFLCNRTGSRIGLLHVGWRGLAAGIVESGIARLAVPVRDVLAWLGPAIGPQAFEVGADVYTALAHDSITRSAFQPGTPGKWYADLYRLVTLRLQQAGVENIYRDENMCTFSQPERFFSYRRDERCGRMASLIWRTGPGTT